ncbi:A24 family peptidase [Phenylobacterium sp. J426]|uniref:prepilin peptidase n=1 Tax=Phenylobacterium sp. J426 TaxID=2898439 RepID=UPI002150CD76|nr:A24 family peptidase [Phenylobacterium sp. J426]MCR5876676.1 A24 family peptidase [Phenylobacterium sp. J426]
MSGLALVATGVLILLLIPVVAIDLRERRIPNVLNLSIGLLGAAFAWAREPELATLGALLLGALLALGILLAAVGVLRLLKRQGQLGAGDIKFLVAASFWVGASGAAWTFVVASLLSVLTLLVLAPWRGWNPRESVPFGPALSAALLTVFIARAVI